MKIETSSWNRPRSWGMIRRSSWKNTDGNVYSISGDVGDPVLGLVSARLSKWRDGKMNYNAECMFHGHMIDATFERPDEGAAFTHKALARWVWKHAIPAMRKHAMEATI